MKNIKIIESLENIGKKVEFQGRVETVRDHGKITFLDISDSTGTIQTVWKKYSAISPQSVVQIEGEVKERPKDLINKDLPTGTVEVLVENHQIISESATPPIPVEGDGYDIDENLRLKYRYLDLRRKRLKDNLKLRHKITTTARDFLNKEGFVEIETPYLSKTTPEGARDFLVPSRLNKGRFYALAQAPQQYKQLLMVAGFEKYFQLARAFRDEDLRADRQFEHTQIDLEMANVKREDIFALIEKMFKEITKSLSRKIYKEPFPIFTYAQAMKKFGKDKFDIREKEDNSLALAWVVDFPLFEYDETEKRYTFSHNPFTAPKENQIDDLMGEKNLKSLLSYQYDLVLNGEELGSGSVRITDPKIQRQIFKIMGFSNEKIDEDFGHLLEAYTYGAPKHGGIAIGLDRLCAIFAGEKSIREVIAFPTSGSGQTSVMNAPSSVETSTLKDLGIKIS
jgi:aspartyl-tRNA synthetase